MNIFLAVAWWYTISIPVVGEVAYLHIICGHVAGILSREVRLNEFQNTSITSKVSTEPLEDGRKVCSVCSSV